MRITLTSEFEPESSHPASAPTPTVPTTSGETEKATENQVRKLFAEMHRIGDDLAKAYLLGHFGTTNPKELHKKTASTAIKWMLSQPAKKG